MHNPDTEKYPISPDETLQPQDPIKPPDEEDRKLRLTKGRWRGDNLTAAMKAGTAARAAVTKAVVTRGNQGGETAFYPVKEAVSQDNNAG